MIVLSVKEQRQLGAAARKVGGYSELIRLDAERRGIKGPKKLVRDHRGRYEYVAAPKVAEKSQPLALDPREWIKAGEDLIPVARVRSVDVSRIEHEIVLVRTDDGEFEARGFDAIEIVMALKPSAVEGRRLRWRKNAWAFHNFIGHPVVQILAWMGFKKAAIRFHDWTTPTPRGGSYKEAKRNG